MTDFYVKPSTYLYYNLSQPLTRLMHVYCTCVQFTVIYVRFMGSTTFANA